MNLEQAVVYDEETYPNCILFTFEFLFTSEKLVYEISQFRDDSQYLFRFLQHVARHRMVMIGFNNNGFDYPILHMFFNNPTCTYRDLYQKSQDIINSQKGMYNGRNTHIIWANKRFAPQIDLLTMHHFDNVAKSTSLKHLEVNMRSHFVVDLPIQHGTVLTKDEIDHILVPYGQYDTSETKKFALHSMEAIKFRISLIPEFGEEVLSWNDTKIGEESVIKKLGFDVCYYRDEKNRRQKRQTIRTELNLREIIFPYVRFEHPEFNRVLDYLKGQTLRQEEILSLDEGEVRPLKTKGVFTGLTANVGGLIFSFGLGGVHASVEKQRIVATDEYPIVDIDVSSLYPNIGIANGLAPEHLGAAFTKVYSQIPIERKEWQAKKGKKCVEANTLKLGANGVYGKSNSLHSVFCDAKYTMTTTVNGQLLICMLAEQLLKIPTLKIIQVNTDGITYTLHRSYVDFAVQVRQWWEKMTRLELEEVLYNRMWVRDVNNYVAEDMKGNLKTKGAYWTPDPLDYYGSISAAQPPAWHKNLSNPVSARAAIAYMVHGLDIETYLRLNTDPYDFTLATKAKGGSQFRYNGQNVQKTCRYYVSTNGYELKKFTQPKGKMGAFKRAPKITEEYYLRIMNEVNWAWDARVCTKSKGVYAVTESSVQAGFKVTICNNMDDFDMRTINYDYYINEARKLII